MLDNEGGTLAVQRVDLRPDRAVSNLQIWVRHITTDSTSRANRRKCDKQRILIAATTALFTSSTPSIRALSSPRLARLTTAARSARSCFVHSLAHPRRNVLLHLSRHRLILPLRHHQDSAKR